MCAQINTLVNGEPLATVSVHDRGFQYGDGLFETIAVYHEAPLLWERHMARLRHGAERLGIAPPLESVLRSEAARLCQGTARAVLKIIVTRGTGGRGYAAHGVAEPTRVLYLSPWPDYPEDFARSGVSIGLCETTLARHPESAGIKHLNRLEQILARAEWRTEYADGIMCDEQGNIIEGTISNVFAVMNGALRTPDVHTCGVEGIMRAVVLEAAPPLNLRCEVGRITLEDFYAASEIFLTNSLIGVWPVRQLQEKEYVIGPITRKIQHAVSEAHCFDRH